MARMKDIKTKCENKLNIFKEKFRLPTSGDHTLKLPYDSSQTCNNISVTKDFCTEMKRISSYGLVTYSITDDAKKHKKSLNALVGLFRDTYCKFPENDPKRGPLNCSALALNEIVEFTEYFRKYLECNVMGPLDNLEKMCTEIQELEKKLHVLKREITSLVDKQARFEDQSTQDEQKNQLIRDQIVTVQTDYDNLTDIYIQRLLAFEASNFQHAEALQEMILSRADYHDKCAKALRRQIPESNAFMEEKRIPLSFGTPLENHLRETKRFIAYPLEFCVKTLSDPTQLQQEGLFRVSGSMNKANLLCGILNLMKCDQVDIDWPPHVVADALKRYLREMPVSLLGKISHSEWEACYEKSKFDKQGAYKQIKELMSKLPKSYYQNIEYLIRFLNQVVQEKAHNLMGIPNICMVFVPNLFKSSQSESSTLSGLNIENNVCLNFILESLLQESNFFFPHSDQSTKISKKILHSIPTKKEDRSSVESEIKILRRFSSGTDKNSSVMYSSNVDKILSPPISRSQRRRQQLQVNPLNLEQLENDLEIEKRTIASAKYESSMTNPPVPPRLKAWKQ